MTPVLEARGLSKRFGGIVATDNVSFALDRGARHALIGPNGAGKTTFLNLLTGALQPSAGTILLEGEDMTAMRPHMRVRQGLARTFQINQLFGDLTPLETMVMAVGEARERGGVWWRSGVDIATLGRAVDILERFQLADVMDQKTAHLPYGRQRLLEIAIAFAGEPKVLLLDEPAAGVPENETHDILVIISDLPEDVSVLLIEHDMDLVFSFAERITVLVNGAILMQGAPQEVAGDPRVREVYLGET